MPHRQFPDLQRNSARRLRSSMSEVCHDAGLVIELDGRQHSGATIKTRDEQRTAWLMSRGYKVLRFWNNDVLRNTSGVLEVIAAEVQQRPPTLLATKRADLPLKGGGEEQVAR